MANIYDMNAAIDKPNFLATALGGLQAGQQQRQLREQRADEATLRQLAPGIMGGDPTALEQAAVIDPARAGQYKAAGDVKWQTLKGGYDLVKRAQASGNPQAVQSAWTAFRPYIQKVTGVAPPEDFATAAPHFDQLGVKLAMIEGGGGQQPDVKVVGDALVDSTGKVLYQGQPQAKYFQTDQGLVEVGPNGVAREVRLGAGTPAPAPANVQIDPALPPEVQRAIAASEAQGQAWDGAVPDAGRPLLPAASLESRQRLELSLAADRRAEEAAARARDADERARLAAERQQQFGTIPAGFRVKADGSGLEPVPGGPKPAGSAATEGERKAATLLQRLNGSLAQMNAAIAEDPDAAGPSIGAEIGRNLPLVGGVLANSMNSPSRQRVEAAQLDILDAALTLGTGAAYTREQLQGYRQAFFPQIGDSEATIRDKAARLQNVIKAAKIAAGRAAPQAQAPATGGYQIGQVIEANGRRYRVTGGDPNDPDVEEVP